VFHEVHLWKKACAAIPQRLFSRDRPMEITSFPHKVEALQRYSRSGQRETLNLVVPERKLGGEHRWHVRLRFDGQTHSFYLTAEEVAAICRDLEIAPHVKNLFGK
jgi:hypothetical protein